MTGRTRRTRRFIAVGVASVGIASIGAASSFGHIPAVGNGLPPSTDGPDLRSIAIAAGTDPYDGETEKVRWCFDATVDSIVDPVNPQNYFVLHTYDSRRYMRPIAVGKDQDPACVVTTFAARVDVAQATMGSLIVGAVKDRASHSNVTASEPVAGSASVARAGGTTGPDLDAVDKGGTPADRTLTFVFDENLDNLAVYDPANFGFYLQSGVEVAGIGAVVVSGKRATVHFGANPALETANRYFVRKGAVQDLPQTGGAPPLATPSSLGVKRTGALTPAPEVISATPEGITAPQSFRVKFNAAVQVSPNVPSGFRAINDDGTTAVPAESVIASGQPDTLLVKFPPGLLTDPTAIVKIVVAFGSVKAAADGTTDNLASEANVQTPNSVAGYTNGPDLEAVAVDPTTNRVAWRYDETIAPTPAGGAFVAITGAGANINALGAGSAAVQLNDRFAIVDFPATVSGAVAFSNLYSGMIDKTGRPNPSQSVSKEIQVAPPPPPPPPPVVKPPPVVAKLRFKTTVTIKRRGRVYSGTVKSARKACRQGRRVILKRRGLQRRFGSKISSKTGKYSIKRTRRLRGRVYAYVTPRSTSINCLPGKSKVIRG